MTAWLDQLRREYEMGQGQLRDLVEREAAMRETLLRIGGAIQVPEEMLSTGDGEPASAETLSVP